MGTLGHDGERTAAAGAWDLAEPPPASDSRHRPAGWRGSGAPTRQTSRSAGGSKSALAAKSSGTAESSGSAHAAAAASATARLAPGGSRPRRGTGEPPSAEEYAQDSSVEPPAPASLTESAEGPRFPQWLSEPVGSVTLWQRLRPDRLRAVRVDPGRRGVLALAAVGVAAVIVAAAAAHRDDPAAAPVAPLPALRTDAPERAAAAAPGEGGGLAVRAEPGARPPTVAPGADAPVGADLVVSVIGLVDHAGLLHLPLGARVADAVAMAVAREGADLTSLNLAQRLADGDQIVVGAPGPAGEPRLGSMVVSGAPHGAAPAGGGSGPAPKVNLNTASEQELDGLTGVGPTTAAAILAWRSRHGRFTSIDQLAEVTGIGPAKLKRLRDQVTL